MKNLFTPMRAKAILALLLVTFMTNSSIMAQKQIPLEDFFKNPEKTSFQISPNGKYFSYTAPYENRMNIFVQKIGSKKATRIPNGNYF